MARFGNTMILSAALVLSLVSSSDAFSHQSGLHKLLERRDTSKNDSNVDWSQWVTINTPMEVIPQCSEVTISWTSKDITNPLQIDAVDNTTMKHYPVAQVNPTSLSYNWTANVPEGTFFFYVTTSSYPSPWYSGFFKVAGGDSSCISGGGSSMTTAPATTTTAPLTTSPATPSPYPTTTPSPSTPTKPSTPTHSVGSENHVGIVGFIIAMVACFANFGIL